ncbi:hypothetical protein BIU97_10280 [Curtobacterium sp. MCBA15_009]|uniref:hypothetical protein n=1 Tax=Curtobacterium sp. MCBA15_009 TaxID=1898737 RepID=UPI0008DD1C65|nr:hypothetical protein [Curtobacterium sp. MCBA15_009]OII10506.1 hypothetical protein BIU97_10280 [Curtobacterium sp. MCBA15_009]
MADFPVSSFQLDDDPPTVELSLRGLDPTPEWDGYTLVLTPDRADELAAALSSKAADARAGLIDIAFTDS